MTSFKNYVKEHKLFVILIVLIILAGIGSSIFLKQQIEKAITGFVPERPPAEIRPKIVPPEEEYREELQKLPPFIRAEKRLKPEIKEAEWLTTQKAMKKLAPSFLAELDSELKEIKQNIGKNGHTWIASFNQTFIKSDEYKKRLCGLKKEAPPKSTSESSIRAVLTEAGGDPLPAFFDWREQHGRDYITSIKDQANCGSCWAFAANASLEGNINAYYNNPNLNPDLSEQDLVSCFHGKGCSGATLTQIREIFSNYYQATGIPIESCFPYTAADSDCSYKCSNWQSVVWKTKSYVDSQSIKETLIESGPVEVGMEVYSDFFSYSGGIYRHVSGSLKGYHAVTIVGFGVYDGQDYWIVKNSWGENWGEEGYFRIFTGECGIDSWFALTAVEPYYYEPQQRLCTDNDKDDYCNWGIGPRPDTCPPCDPTIEDCNDSNPTIHEGCGAAVDKTGWLSVTSDPTDASVFVADPNTGDYFYRGQTPLKTKLNTGTRQVKITKAGYADYETEVVIEERKLTNLSITLIVFPPVLSTGKPSNIYANLAFLSGELIDMGGALSCEVWFEWGKTTDYGNNTLSQTKDSTGSFAAKITDLTPETTYHFRAVANNKGGTSYGDDVTFTTTNIIAKELVTNGDFESGDLTGWRSFGTGDHKADTIDTFTGSFAGLIGYRDAANVAGGKSAIYQKVTIPVEAISTNLSLWYKFYTKDHCNYDWINIYLKDSANNVLKTYLQWCCKGCSGLNTYGWNQIIDDLSAYAGQTVRIYFEVENRIDAYASYKSWAYIDEASILTALPSITVTSPNGGETWGGGKTYDITWNSAGVDTVSITLIDYRAGPVETTIAANLSASLGKYSWTIPTNITPGTSAFKIAIKGKAIEDLSDDYFSIVVISPCDNYGDVNEDGYLTNADITTIENCILGLSCTTEQKLRADVNNDGLVDMGDVTTFERYLAGADATLAACSKTPPCDSYGDINENNFVNLRDAKLISDYLAGTADLTLEQKKRADVNKNATVDGEDASLITQYAKGVINTFLVCDTTPPTISNPQPLGTITNNAPTISVSTNEPATCKYNPIDTSYDLMMNIFSTTGATTHSSKLNGLADASYTFYVRCQDQAGNQNTASAQIKFTVSTAVTNYIWQSCETGILRGPLSYNSSMGYKFIPKKDGLITKLCGYFDGTKTVKLYASTYKVIANASVTSSHKWACTSISPVSVKANSIYYVVGEIGGKGGYYRLWPRLPKTCNDVTIGASVYQYPSGTFNAMHYESKYYMYGMVDIEISFGL